MDSLIVSVSEAAELLGVSSDLVYELTARGEIPYLRVGRRKLIPRRAIELMVEAAVDGFDPIHGAAALARALERVKTRRAGWSRCRREVELAARLHEHRLC